MRLCLAIFALALGLQAIEIPPGTEIRIRLGETLSSNQSHAGDRWEGTVQRDVLVGEKIVARRGDPVEGRVVTATPSGRLAGQAVLELELTKVNGIPVATGNVIKRGEGHAGRNAEASGGTAAFGAVLGAIVGGGAGAAIGAGAGAAAGTAGAAATGKKDIKYPVETLLIFSTR